jgi:hypothetical protein
VKGWCPGHGWTKTATGYLSPCGNYTVYPVGAMTDDGTKRLRSKPFFRLMRISDGTDFGLHRGACIAIATAERDARRRVARGR